MRAWIDTEFNEYRGALISLAIVCENGEEFYEVLPCPNPGLWVARHVMPILNKSPVSPDAFAYLLEAFISRFEQLHLIADWPEDIAYFCNALITGPGQCVNYSRLSFEIAPDCGSTADASAVPHNALHDARGFKSLYAAAGLSGDSVPPTVTGDARSDQ